MRADALVSSTRSLSILSIETAARAKGVTRLLLDTNSRLPEAVAMYRHSGWTQIERFNDDPYPDVFFEKRL